MRQVRFERRASLPSLWAILFLAFCVGASMFITAATTPGATTGPAPASTARPAPTKPEESATIPDDPTLVPDDKESADNNVTFPVDI